MNFPTISVVLAALNSESVIENCLSSIAEQDYPKDKVEVIIADGGSTDRTVAIAEKYGAKIYKNDLKTSESGKAVGVKRARGELTAFIDSDNILPDKNWFKKMVQPFSDRSIVLSEPIEYTYRPHDHVLTRYFALLGMNDPICLFLGNYDRISTLTGRWTDLNFTQQDRGDYIKVKLDRLPLPTIGANGTFIRKSALIKYWHGDYLFDVDIIIKIVKERGVADIAKVKIGIVHTFVESSPFKFFRKQLRRVNDMMYHRKKGAREIDWQGAFFLKIVIFQVKCALVFPIFFQMIKGYLTRPDIAWFFHPVAVYSTWFIYLYGWLVGNIRPQETSRQNWKQ